MSNQNNRWSLVYKKAILDDGSLLFPERLNREFLENARKTMGVYLFANQFQNEVIPEEEKTFKPQWLRHFDQIPPNCHTFCFIDPAIGQKNHHDYTGIAIIHAATDGTWYLDVAARSRMTPTQIVDTMFHLHERYKFMAMGIETQAYQEALLYLLDQEMKKRQKMLPVKGIKRAAISKQTRILGLVPRFEWNRILINRGMTDFEDEYGSFPRGAHDDILDALASLEELVFYPQKEVAKLERPNSPNHPDYERWFIQNIHRGNPDPGGPSWTE